MIKLMSGLKKQVGIFNFSSNFPFEERIFIKPHHPSLPSYFLNYQKQQLAKFSYELLHFQSYIWKITLQTQLQCWIYFDPDSNYFTSQLLTFKSTKEEMKTIKLFRFSNPRLRKHLCEELLKNRWCENGKIFLKYLNEHKLKWIPDILWCHFQYLSKWSLAQILHLHGRVPLSALKYFFISGIQFPNHDAAAVEWQETEL